MILIIKNGLMEPHISKYLEFEEYQVIYSSNLDIKTINIDNYSVIIILGGYQTITQIENYPELQNVIEIIKKCIQKNKSILGICLGSQLIAYSLGCEIKSSEKLNVGYNSNLLCHKNIFRCHQDYIVPNNEICPLEYFEGMINLYKYGDKIYGIQCHPDIPPETVCKYSDHKLSVEYAQKNDDIINQKNLAIISYFINLLK